ncbi:MAG TPA: hypothetical protein VM659_23805, partial [Dongiaceae bacterium]|nr:hypothetical protein [Dongiaceae bacterium]
MIDAVKDERCGRSAFAVIGLRWQSGFLQPFRKHCEILWPTDRNPLPKVRDAERGVKAAEVLHGACCFIGPSAKR